MVTAIKHAGVRLYKLARQGKTIKREPRLVHVYRYAIDRIALPKIDFTVVCSKGFYVRTYAHDVGLELGGGAHLYSLRAVQAGRCDVEKARSVEHIENRTTTESVGGELARAQVSHR